MEDRYSEDEDLRRQQRAERLNRMRREKEKREKLNRIARKCVLYGGCVLCVVVGLWIGSILRHRFGGEKEISDETEGASVASAESMQESSEDGSELPQKSLAAAEPLFPDQEQEGAGSLFIGSIDKAEPPPEPEPIAGPPEIVDGKVQVGDVEFLAALEAIANDSTITVGDSDVLSDYALLIDESTNEIVAQKNAQATINPASMTKILTVLVAAEHVSDLDEKVTITVEMTDYAYINDCSIAGFEVGEVVTVRDLFYGTILPSGAEAAAALAEHVAGSREAFVELMNDKLEELGISDTAHFTNCVGIYDENHYCKVSDMAIILKAAVEDDWCREVLSAHRYTTSATVEHPEGLTISNLFLRRIEDHLTGGEVLCAKTGFVDESRNCAASYFVSDSGVPYICVTAGAQSSWRCIYDHVAMYSLYAGGEKK
ncbi:MAG: serine hydrolase [Candidatus Gastranaerophilales bacterium]|nr:serine hydrolase [Candidatus Gastranaerophilales bacterium]